MVFVGSATKAAADAARTPGRSARFASRGAGDTAGRIRAGMPGTAGVPARLSSLPPLRKDEFHESSRSRPDVSDSQSGIWKLATAI